MQGATRTLYDVLGISATSTAGEIRTAYRLKALSTHPDKHGTKEEFHEVVQAFEILSSALARGAYDRRLEIHAAQGEEQAGCRQQHQRSKRPRASPGGAKDPSKSAERANAWGAGAREHHGTRFDKARQQALSRLQNTITAVNPDERKLAFDAMPVRVRSALIEFMEPSRPTTNPKAPPATSSVRPSSSEGPAHSQLPDMVTSSSVADSCESSSEESLLALPWTGLDNVTDQTQDAAISPSAEARDTQSTELISVVGLAGKSIPTSLPCTRQQWNHCTSPMNVSAAPGARNKTGRRGVYRLSALYAQYRAAIHFLHLRIHSRVVPSLEAAIDFHTVLVSTKQWVLDGLSRSANACELCNRIRTGLAAACQECHVAPSDMGLVFGVMLRVPKWLGKTVISGQITDDLERTVVQREYLVRAMRSDWQAFRGAWIQLMQEEQSSCAWGRAVKRPKSAEEAAAFADAVFEARRDERDAVAERAQQREELRRRRRLGRVQAAACRVEMLLEAERRAQAAADARARRRKALAERLRREARWRWQRDPRRTLEELLRGPPGDGAPRPGR